MYNIWPPGLTTREPFPLHVISYVGDVHAKLCITKLYGSSTLGTNFNWHSGLSATPWMDGDTKELIQLSQ